MKKFLILPFLLSAQFSMALVVTEFEMVEGDKIPKAATLDAIAISKVGTGIREKNAFLGIKVNVYRASLLAAEPAKFSRDANNRVALDSLLAMDAFALQLLLKRDVSAEDMVVGFETALKENGVADSPALMIFKTKLRGAGNIAAGQTVTITVNRKTNTLKAEHAQTKIEIKGDDKLFGDIFSIWLGKPADAELGTLKAKIISGK